MTKNFLGRTLLAVTLAVFPRLEIVRVSALTPICETFAIARQWIMIPSGQRQTGAAAETALIHGHDTRQT